MSSRVRQNLCLDLSTQSSHAATSSTASMGLQDKCKGF